MTRPRFPYWLLTALFPSVAPFAVADAVSDDTPSTLTPGARVRVEMAPSTSTWVVGELLGTTTNSLRMTEGGTADTLTVAREALHRLQLSQGRRSRAGTGALIGGGLGSAFGMTVVIAFASDPFFDVTAGDAAALTVGFALAGVIVGGLIGSLIHSEHWVDAPAPWEPVAASGP